MKTVLLVFFIATLWFGVESYGSTFQTSKCAQYSKEAYKYRAQSQRQPNIQLKSRFQIISMKYQYQYTECIKFESRKKEYKGYR